MPAPMTKEERQARIAKLLEQEAVISARLKSNLWKLRWLMFRPWLIGLAVTVGVVECLYRILF